MSIKLIDLIDKNLLFTVGSTRNVLLCVKNILPQDLGCVTNELATRGLWFLLL
jgi:hypothetical protein